MDVKPLLDVACAKVASMIKGNYRACFSYSITYVWRAHVV